MLERGKMDRDLVEFVVIDQLVPKEHLLRKIDTAVDFTRLYEMVEPLYCEDNGRPSIDPVVLFKMVLIQHLYGLPSLRRTAEEVSANNCYRWFLGYPLQEETPHFSTVSYNFRHRFTEETVDWVFARILDEVAKAGYHFRTENLKRRNPLNHRIKWHFLPTEVPEEPKYSKKRRLHPITIPAMVRLRLTPQNYSDVSFNGVA